MMFIKKYSDLIVVLTQEPKLLKDNFNPKDHILWLSENPAVNK